MTERKVAVPAMPARARVLAALRGAATDRTPVWFKRQAGPHLTGYSALTERLGFQAITTTPDLVAEIMAMPVDQLDVDAAVLYADVTQPLPAMGVGLSVSYTDGPSVDTPVRSRADFARLHEPAVGECAPSTAEGIRLLCGRLGNRVAVVGSCGAPLTVACYLVEGGHHKGIFQFPHLRALLHGDPVLFEDILAGLATTLAHYALEQIDAGIDVLQVFDTWAPILHPRDYERFVLPHLRTLVSAASTRGVPVILTGLPEPALGLAARSGASGVEPGWTVDLAPAWRAAGVPVALGNLDPAVLLGSPDVIAAGVDAVLAEAAGRAGHIFSASGPIPGGVSATPLARVVEQVHGALR